MDDPPESPQEAAAESEDACGERGPGSAERGLLNRGLHTKGVEPSPSSSTSRHHSVGNPPLAVTGTQDHIPRDCQKQALRGD